VELELKVVLVVVVTRADGLVQLGEPFDAEGVGLVLVGGMGGGEADERVRCRGVDAAHEADLVGTLGQVGLVDADLVSPQEALGRREGLGPEVAGDVEGVGEVGEDVEADAVDEDGRSVSGVSGAIRYRGVLLLHEGEGDGREEVALDKAIVVVEMKPYQANFLTRAVQRLIDAAVLELIVARSWKDVPRN